MVKKIGSAIPGLKPKGSGRFFYPLQGYGQISDAYYQAGREAGAECIMKAKVESLEQVQGQETRWTVHYEKDGQKDAQSVDHVWSTIPITILAKAINPPPPQHLLEAAQGLHYRAMILVYLVLEQDRFSEYDAHYFPGKEIAITRLSEPKNYSNRQNPQGVTVLCAELPCSINDPEWGMSDDDLGRLVYQSLETAGIPVRAPVRQVAVRRLRQAYPIYSVGYEAYFDQLDAWLGKFENLLTFGRQGLFAHDNTHHALFMAYSAVECLDPGGKFNADRWMEFRKIFETHVVED